MEITVRTTPDPFYLTTHWASCYIVEPKLSEVCQHQILDCHGPHYLPTCKLCNKDIVTDWLTGKKRVATIDDMVRRR